MDIVTIVVEALKLIFPAYCANAAPVLAGGGLPWILARTSWMGDGFSGRTRLSGVSSSA